MKIQQIIFMLLTLTIALMIQASASYNYTSDVTGNYTNIFYENAVLQYKTEKLNEIQIQSDIQKHKDRLDIVTDGNIIVKKINILDKLDEMEDRINNMEQTLCNQGATKYC